MKTKTKQAEITDSSVAVHLPKPLHKKLIQYRGKRASQGFEITKAQAAQELIEKALNEQV